MSEVWIEGGGVEMRFQTGEGFNGACDLVKYQGKRFCDRSANGFMWRWGAFLNGTEVSQTGSYIGPNGLVDVTLGRLGEMTFSAGVSDFTSTLEIDNDLFEGPAKGLAGPVKASWHAGFLDMPGVIKLDMSFELIGATNGEWSENANAAKIYGRGTKVPDFGIIGPNLHFAARRAHKGILYALPNKDATVRDEAADDAPGFGGGIMESGDHQWAVGIFGRELHYGDAVVRWRRGQDPNTEDVWREMAYVQTSRDGRTERPGTFHQQAFICLGTLDEVKSSFHAIYDYYDSDLESAGAQVESAVSEAAIEINSA